MTTAPDPPGELPPGHEPPTTTVLVATKLNTVERPAWQTGVPGLVVVNVFRIKDAGTDRRPLLYTLVHAWTGRQVGGVWSSLANAITAAVAVHTALHIDWTVHVDPAVGHAVQMHFDQVHEDLRDWPVGRPVRVATPLRNAGDNHAAAAAVICTTAGRRYILLVERADGGGWEIPGGRVEDGETPESAARRELLEETGVDVTGVHAWHLTQALPVDDPRNTSDRRIVTDLFLFILDQQPAPRHGTDLVSASWIPFDSRSDFEAAISSHGSVDGRATFVYRPHPQLLAIVRDELRTLDAIDAYFEANVRDSWRGVAPDEVEHQKRKYQRDVRGAAAATEQVLAWVNQPGISAAAGQHR